MMRVKWWHVQPVGFKHALVDGKFVATGGNHRGVVTPYWVGYSIPGCYREHLYDLCVAHHVCRNWGTGNWGEAPVERYEVPVSSWTDFQEVA